MLWQQMESAYTFSNPRDAWLLQGACSRFRELINGIGPKADELENDIFGKLWIKQDSDSKRADSKATEHDL